MKVVYTLEALRDLDEIATWLKTHYPGAGVAVERRIRLVFAHIARWPKACKSLQVSNHHRNVRVAPLGHYPYKIFYRVRDNTVEILHVHHAARAPWSLIPDKG